jgi:hypothetical protein
LKAEDGTPLQPNDPQFVVAYAAAREARRKPATGTLFSLIAAYKDQSNSRVELKKRRRITGAISK